MGFMMGDTSNGFNINITSPRFGLLPVHVGRRGRVSRVRPIPELPMGHDPRGVGGERFRSRVHRADGQVAYMLETAMSKGDGIRFDPMEGREDTVRLFRLLLETAKCADIPVRFAGGSGGLRQGD